jgi:hypothetical protein
MGDGLIGVARYESIKHLPLALRERSESCPPAAAQISWRDLSPTNRPQDALSANGFSMKSMPPNPDQRTHAQSRRTAKATPSVMGRIAHKQTLQAP